MSVDDWITRMRKLRDSSDKIYHNKNAYMLKYCEYGRSNFCDGRINKTDKKWQKAKEKPPCKYFVDGKCEKRLHKGKEG